MLLLGIDDGTDVKVLAVSDRLHRQHPKGSSTNNQGLSVFLFSALFLDRSSSPGKADEGHEKQLKRGTNDIVSQRHAPDREICSCNQHDAPDHLDHRRNQPRKEHIVGRIPSRKLPHPTIEAEKVKNNDAENGIDRSEVKENIRIKREFISNPEKRAHPIHGRPEHECQKIGQIHRKDVQHEHSQIFFQSVHNICPLRMFHLVGQGGVCTVLHNGGGIVRMIGIHHGGNIVANIRAIMISRVHEVLHLREKQVLVKGNGLADMNQFILGLGQAFFGHELFFIKLLAGAETGVFDLDIHVGLEAGEADQVAGQGVDLHGRAHIKDEDLAAVGVGPGKHHEADGLGNRHKIANNIRVGHGNRAALGDLLLKEGDHGTVGTQDIPEADGDELGSHIPESSAEGLAPVGLIAQVGEELGQLVGTAGLDLRIKGLNNHLAEALRSAHDIRRVHGLVRGDQDKALTAMHHGGVGGLIGPEGVVLDRLAGAVLHEGNMLMGRSVIDNLRMKLRKHLEHSSAVADRADQGHEVQVRIGILQLILDIIGVVLIDVKNNQLLWMVCRDLSAELRTDGPAAAGDENDLPAHEVIDFLHLGTDLVTAEEVLDRDVLHIRDGDIALGKLGDAGHDLQLAVGLLADIQDITALFEGGTRNGKVDLLDLILLDILENRLAAADHGDPVDKTAPLIRIVVHDTDDLLPHVGHALDISKNNLAGAARADEHHAAIGTAQVLLMQEENHPIRKADPGHEKELNQGASEIIGQGHTVEEEGNPPSMQSRRHQGGKEDADQLREAGETPDAVIQAEDNKNHEADHRICGNEHAPGVPIDHRDIRKLAIVADPEGQEVREAHRGGIVQGQEHGDDLPMLNQGSFFAGFTIHGSSPLTYQKYFTTLHCEKSIIRTI